MAVPFPSPKVCKPQTTGKPCKLFVTSTLSGLWQEDIPLGIIPIVLLSLSSDRQETWGYGQPEWLITLVCENKRPAFPHPCLHSDYESQAELSPLSFSWLPAQNKQQVSSAQGLATGPVMLCAGGRGGVWLLQMLHVMGRTGWILEED